VYGVSPVLAALSAGRRKLGTLYVQRKSSATRDSREVQRALDAANALGVRVAVLDKGELNNMARNRPHQGLLLSASRLVTPGLDSLPPFVQAEGDAAPFPVWLALDEVQDPQNLGALLRCTQPSILCTPPFNNLSYHTSQRQVHATNNLVRTLQKSRENGWTVVGAALGKPGTTVRSQDLALSGPTVLVLGNEGKGLRTLVRRQCDVLVAIPRGLQAALAGKVAMVDSLNVSVAGAILLHQLLCGAEAE
ncbi:Alpha/beta knot methyltransferase, partial [Pavlovales sp. CCMP2436]